MIRVGHESDVGTARRAARDAAQRAGLDEEDAGRAALVATELATNLVRHARDGAVFIRRLEPLERPGVEILSVDRGPGIPDVERATQDGYSTRGGPGHGLVAMRRMADAIGIDSRPGEGTIVVAEIGRGERAGGYAIGGLLAPLMADGCGDAYAVEAKGRVARVLVADGLGHGPDAAVAADAVVEVFRRRGADDLAGLFQSFDKELRATRGAAVAVAEIDPAAGMVRFTGVGNIAAVLIASAGSRNMVSHNGIVGHAMRRTQVFEYPFQGSATVVMHTDGLTQRWKPEVLIDRPTLHPAMIAARLWRSETRGRDDAGVLVVRTEP